MYYGPQILLETGIKVGDYDKKSPELGIILNIPLAFVNALGNVIAVFYIDKLGRRYIMIRTIPGVLIACIIVSFSFYLSLYGKSHNDKEAGSFLSLTGLILYLIFFSIGWSSPVWSTCAEIFPLHLIGIATSLTTATNWGSNFIVSSVFLSILKYDQGKVLAFLILAGFSAMTYAFVYFRVPETKGKPIIMNVNAILGIQDDQYEKEC